MNIRLVPDAARPVRGWCLGVDVDGVGIVPLIRDGAEASPHDVLHFDFERQWAVRRGDWKLICNAIDVLPNDRNKTLEGLYLTNLKIDRTESENLIDRYPKRRRSCSRCAGPTRLRWGRTRSKSRPALGREADARRRGASG